MEGFVYTAVNVKNGQNLRISATKITNSVQSYEGFLEYYFPDIRSEEIKNWKTLLVNHFTKKKKNETP